MLSGVLGERPNRIGSALVLGKQLSIPGDNDQGGERLEGFAWQFLFC
jgi:hypothetical protein